MVGEVFQKFVKIFGAILILFILGAGALYINDSYIQKPTLITVTGEGKVLVKPEIVKFTVSLVNTGTSAVDAVEGNRHLTQNLISVLKNAGVLEKDLNIAYTRVLPPGTIPGQNQYQAVNTIDATLNSVTAFEGLTNQIYAQGGQTITNIIYTTKNSKDLEKQAVAKAIEDAKGRAAEIAQASGKRLGRMLSIATSEIGTAGALSGQAPLGTTYPSQIEITRQASIVFELR